MNIKKTFLLVIFIFIAFCTMQYTKAATETINLEKIPVLEVNQHNAPQIIDSETKQVTPLIEPAQKVEKPTLNLNLGNLKSIKEGAILPDENANLSLNEYVRYYNCTYDKVFSNLLGVLENTMVEVNSYDSKTGKILTTYKKKKAFYVTVSQYNTNTVMVKMTPDDGVYDFPQGLPAKIFMELEASLTAK